MQKLQQSAKDDQRRSDIEKAAKRLVDMTSMGQQYKVLGVLGRPGGVPADGVEMWPFMNVAPVSRGTGT